MLHTEHNQEARSVSQGDAGTEPRDRAARTVTLFLLGRLRTDRGDGICRIRNVSSGGMQIETFSPLKVGQRVEVAARNESPVRGHVAWASGTTAGIKFSAPIDSRSLLRPPVLPLARNVSIRAPRFATRTRAVLTIEGKRHDVRVFDISPGGVRLGTSAALPQGSECHLAIPGLPRCHGTIRWADEDSAGIFFTEKLGFASLAPWLDDQAVRFAEDDSAQ
ncbi:PilZ domain-containing protein [Stakelama marina]|uniref:PilZ domain-containing protein n=1 Tax=Stakelama marina TaxID=2826939 RepID=A0A8T4IAV4_9SPHN|nr:PilZ domain-containing protein [Stakelama marina]MBR0550954.1 PilZ domain-containing protein [Stakelama marina]